MKRRLFAGGALLACSAWSASASATVEAFGMPEQRIGDHVLAMRLGMEPVPLIELGYVRDGLFRAGKQPFDAGASLSLPLLLVPRARDFRLGAGVSTRLALARNLGLALGALGFWQRAEDDAASAQAFGFELGLSPRYRSGGFYVGLPLRLRATAVSLLSNKDYMRFAYDDRYDNGASNDPGVGAGVLGPHDGAYGWPALRVFVGVEAGFSLRRWAFAAGLGGWWSAQAQHLFATVETGQIPLYLQLEARHAL
jgi:hypothetical protein